MSRLRRVIAERMLESISTTAQLTTVIEVDMSHVVVRRNRYRTPFAEREGLSLTFLSFIAKAVVEAIKLHPIVNATIDTGAGTITYQDSTHLGIAVDTPRGLLVPVIRNADGLNIAGLARHIADVAERTRASRISPGCVPAAPSPSPTPAVGGPCSTRPS